jgi:hypothetical protein
MACTITIFTESRFFFTDWRHPRDGQGNLNYRSERPKLKDYLRRLRRIPDQKANDSKIVPSTEALGVS